MTNVASGFAVGFQCHGGGIVPTGEHRQANI